MITILALFTSLLGVQYCAGQTPESPTKQCLDTPTADRFHSCVVRPDGTVWCTGENQYDKLGDPNFRDADSLRMRQVPGITDAINVTTGFYSTFAILSDGTLMGWGLNNFNQIHSTNNSDVLAPTPVYGLTGVVDVAITTYSVCALINTGGVKCWGVGLYGQVGNGSGNATIITPPHEAITTGTQQLVGYNSGYCALAANGTVSCWGLNTNGRFGTGDTDDLLSPTPINGWGSVKEVGVGHLHACVVQVNSSVWCAGGNGYAQLGNGDTTDHVTPQMSNYSGADPLELFVQHYSHCILGKDGRLSCVGLDEYGMFGVGSTTEGSLADATKTYQMSPLPDVTKISVGLSTSFAQNEVGEFFVTGRNQNGQFGNNDTSDTLSFQPLDTNVCERLLPVTVADSSTGLVVGAILVGCVVVAAMVYAFARLRRRNKGVHFERV